MNKEKLTEELKIKVSIKQTIFKIEDELCFTNKQLNRLYNLTSILEYYPSEESTPEVDRGPEDLSERLDYILSKLHLINNKISNNLDILDYHLEGEVTKS